MSVRLIKTYHWSSGVVWDGVFMINSYEAQLEMLAETPDPELQNLAYNRMNYWIYSVMQDSTLIGQANEAIPAYQATGQRLIVMPDEPVDQLVGMMLYSKLNAIMEHHILITKLTIGSRLGDDMFYVHDQDENLGMFSEAGWWQDPRPRWSDAKSRRTKNNVISINRAPEWKELDLDWHPVQDHDQESGVLFASFRKDEDQPVQ